MLARLNLNAGKKAKSSTAYQAALGYFTAGLALLGDEAWIASYELMLELNIEAAECEYLCGRYAEAERYFEALLARARTRLDSARVHNLRVLQYENMSRYADAVAAGREGLTLFGMRFPETAGDKDNALEAELRSIDALLGDRNIAELIELPRMEDLESRAVMRLLTAMWAPAYVAGDQELTRLISATMTRLSLERGNIEESAYGYVTHAITAGSVKGDYKSGLAYGELALAVNERFRDPKHRAKVHHMFSCFVNVWRRPMATCIPYAREACRSGFETGDFAYANYGVFHESWYGMLASSDLGRFLKEYGPNTDVLRKLKMESFVETQKIVLNWARVLQGGTRSRLSLASDDFDEEAFLSAYGAHPFFMTFYWVVKLYAAISFEAYDAARETARKARQVVHALGGTVWPVLLMFLGGLTDAASCETLNEEERKERIGRLEVNDASLRHIAENSPENFLCFSLLVRAELHRVRHEASEAIAKYEEAIHAADGIPMREALALELYARFWRRRGNNDIAGLYYDKARLTYQRWGASEKVRHIEETCSELLPGRPPSVPVAETEAIPIDIAAVAKAAHAISVEIVLEDLLRRLMEIALENAGAQRGFFFQERDGELLAQAEGELGPGGIQVLQAVPLKDVTHISAAVVRFAWHTGESVVVGDAIRDERFAEDPYINSARPHSILCVPVKHQGKSAGILYLENNLAPDAFTAERIRVMQILSSQAAISLENARIYDEVRQEVVGGGRWRRICGAPWARWSPSGSGWKRRTSTCRKRSGGSTTSKRSWVTARCWWNCWQTSNRPRRRTPPC